MLIKRLDHVGIVVYSVDESLRTYCDEMGFRLLQRMSIPEQLVEAAFLDAGNSTIELIAPTDAESGTARFLQKRGEGPHHVCYEVDDIVQTLAALRDEGVQLIDETAAPGRSRAGCVCASQGDTWHDDRAAAEAGGQ